MHYRTIVGCISTDTFGTSLDLGSTVEWSTWFLNCIRKYSIHITEIQHSMKSKKMKRCILKIRPFILWLFILHAVLHCLYLIFVIIVMFHLNEWMTHWPVNVMNNWKPLLSSAKLLIAEWNLFELFPEINQLNWTELN